MRYNWVVARLDRHRQQEMTELVIDAWCMVVPKRVAAEHLGDAAGGPGQTVSERCIESRVVRVRPSASVDRKQGSPSA